MGKVKMLVLSERTNIPFLYLTGVQKNSRSFKHLEMVMLEGPDCTACCCLEADTGNYYFF